MVMHYDPGLRHMLPANTSNGGIVLNSAFSKWEDYIATNLRTRTPTGGERYEKGDDARLLRLCREHAMAYQGHAEGHNTVVLTHPFYLQLSHMHELRTTAQKNEASKYLDALLDFLSLDRSGKAAVVALETVHHYAAATSLLLEQKLIDHVIFTLYDKGYLLNDYELKPFSEHDIYCGGAYNMACLSQSIDEVAARAPEERIWAIRDLSLDLPFWGTTLNPEGIVASSTELVLFDNSRVITLEKAVERMGLQRKKMKQ